MLVSPEGRVGNQNEPKRQQLCGRLGSIWFSTRFTRNRVIRLERKQCTRESRAFPSLTGVQSPQRFVPSRNSSKLNIRHQITPYNHDRHTQKSENPQLYNDVGFQHPSQKLLRILKPIRLLFCKVSLFIFRLYRNNSPL